MSITKIKNSVSSRVAAGAVGITMALALLGSAAPAQAAALTSSQVSAIVSLLQSFGADAATIANVQASLTGGTTTTTTTTTSTSCTVTFSRSLTVGSTGADVQALQKFLNANGAMVSASGAGSPGMESMYFGPATKAAVAKYQAMNAISPAVGYFGPLTMASVNSKCTTSTTGGSTTTTTTGPLTGTGRLTNISALGDVTSTIHEGDSSTAVVGVSAMATGGDVQLQRVDATFDMTGVSTGSINMNKYASSIELWLGSTKLASMDPTAGDLSSSVWTYRFGNLNAVIKSGQTGNIYVKIVPLSSIGTNENGKTVTAKLLANSVRAIGADNISDTYVSTAATQAFTVNSATAGTLTISVAADNPAASQVMVASSTTSGVKLLNFTAKAKNSDSKITDLAVSLGTSDNNLNDVVNTVYLMQGSTIVSSKTVSTGTYGVVTFNNINQTIAKDQTVEYTIAVDIKGDSAYVDGTTLIASSTTAGWTVQDSSGTSITPSAAAVGNTMTLTATGISVTAAGSPTATVNVASFSGGLDTAQFGIPFTVTAGDTAVFIDNHTTRLASVSTTPSASAGGVNYATTTSSTNGSATASTSLPTATLTAGTVGGVIPSQDTSTMYYVPANTSRTFTLNAAASAGSGNTAGTLVGIALQLAGVNYCPTSTACTTYYTSNLSSFQTPLVYVQKH